MAICYQDRIYCTYWESCCLAPVCDKPLTDDVRKAAAKWWESFNIPNKGPPIAVYGEPPSCYRLKLQVVK